MNKTFIIALMSAGLLTISSAEVLAQRGPVRNPNTATDTRGSKSANTDASSRNNNSSVAGHANAPGSHGVTPAKPSTSKPSPAAPALTPKGQHAHTATSNKNLPPKRVTPNENYRKMHARGAFVSKHEATNKAQVIRHNNNNYYYKKGVFYQHDHARDKYVVCHPPIGVRVKTIPTPRIVVVKSVRYYYYYGTYYHYNVAYNDYEVVQAPVGAVVESIPDGYEKLLINGETYYIVDGVQYKAVIYDGEIWYEVIKILN